MISKIKEYKVHRCAFFDRNLIFVESCLFSLLDYEFYGAGVAGRYHSAGDPQGGDTAVPEVWAERLYHG
jgi:hypothetical protein